LQKILMTIFPFSSFESQAQPKHLSCIAVSAFHLACSQHRKYQEEAMTLKGKTVDDVGNLITVPEPADLVTISQSRCSPSDLMRMQAILSSKLDLNPASGPEPPVTPLTLLRLMHVASRAAALRLGLDDDLLPEEPSDGLVHKLEILSCDSLTLAYRPAEVALALLAADFQRRALERPEHASALMGLVAELQKYSGMPSGSFVECLNLVVSLLGRYDGEGTVTHRQRLIWKLSNRTLRHLRPTDKLRPTLPTIKEGSNAAQKPRLR